MTISPQPRIPTRRGAELLMLVFAVVVVVAAIIRAGDEFERRIHLVALALSFGSALLLLTLLDWLVRARFMRAPPLIAVWLACAVLWLLWLIVVKRRFERES